MAFDAFLKIQAIKSGTGDSAHKDWIVIESFSWGEERPPTGVGVAEPLEAQFVANVQGSSPDLFQACARGDNLGTVNLEVSTPIGDRAEVFYKWDLTDAVIGSYRTAGNTADDPRMPVDRFTIAFRAMTYTVSAQDAKGGFGNEITRTVDFGGDAPAG